MGQLSGINVIVLVALGLAGGPGLRASEPLRWGVQLGLAQPGSGDLKVTAGSGLHATLGFHGEWALDEQQALRGRLDLTFFARGYQQGQAPGLSQELWTRVTADSLGAEYLFRPNALGGRWALGAGLYAIRWTVDSTQRLQTSGGTFAPSGSSTWTRQGLGVLAGYRWTSHAETELRFVTSHLGYQNQPARSTSLSLLWHF